ncbi:MAG TPA: ABC transporter ATP-binding protein [Candidatus Coproplasma excrementigallinarum]|uniref:ABC transporter ATP-binding protein n=1 Tax=Candidatus Coproplasma excrementigallinarum TaxID=2840747 RepID=A0A9D1SIH9_9FIRM|nr:ABC transporter ATP-binding protein [Candidatus Coproplasma excrementigallinarum]
MLRLYKNLRASDCILIVLIVGITVLQVFLTIQLTDQISTIVGAIQCVSEKLPGWDTGDIWREGGIMLAYAVGSALCLAATGVTASHVASRLSATLRNEVYKKTESFSIAEINKFSTASLITRTTNDIQQIHMANLLVLRMLIYAPIMAIWAICKINASSWQLTSATVVTVVVLVICILAIMLTVLPKFKLMQKLTDKLNGVTRENLTGIRVVRAYNAEKYQENKFEKANKEITGTQLFTGRVMALMNPLMMLAMNGLTLAIYWIGASLMNAGEIEYQTIVAFMTLASQVIMAFLMLLMMFVLLPRAQVAAKRINEVLSTPLTISDPAEEKPLTEEGTVEFRDVSFRYPDADADVFEHISFRAEKGQTVAFIGSTGSGKSTLINLIPRFYDATEGEVLVDGVNVKDIKQSTLRDKIGYVPQKGILFTGTVSDNIAFGGKADRVEIEAAARIAEADGFISEMENGYDSPISQGGKNVSGGQKQRLAIARAVAQKPEIMIFDDSFSALDYKTDRKVRENLKNSLEGVTNLIVAQRIGTIMDADKIIVLDNGKAVGEGTHRELLETCPVYRDIALSQLSKEELGL